jgi:hypothetical protein
LAWRVAHPHNDDHENGLIHDDPARGEAGAIAPRTMALFAIGFVLGAVAIGSMGIAITPEDPPAVRPIELRSPEQRDGGGDGGGDGADRRGDGVERRRGSEGRDRSRPRAPAAPQRRGQRPAQTAPPPAAPRSRTPAPRPNPAPRSRTRPQPAPSAPAPPQPAPAPPPADDDEGGEDPGGDDDATGDDAGGTGELDDDVD